MTPTEKDEALFKRKLVDKCDKALSEYSPSFTSFLDGRQKRTAVEVFSQYSDRLITLCYGGFSEAERVCIGVFPKDIYGYTEDLSELYDMFDVSAVEICGSGFSKFGHRDVMGSVLGLGIKRDVVGDIYLPDDKSAYICMTSVAADYVCDNLEFVARDKVKVVKISCNNLPKVERQFAVISGTVASDRLDCIVSLCTGLSREKTKQLISGCSVSLNHFEETRCDELVREGDVISVRGFGRFVLRSHGGMSKKGRLKTVVHKMI